METQGTVAGIYTGPEMGKPLTAQTSAHAIAGRGVVGDRYCAEEGTSIEPDSEITLVEVEQIEAFNESHDLALTPADLRRTIVTRGVALNDMVGKDFRVGETVLRGHRLCEPCNHLADMTDRRILKGMVHRAGLRAQIVSGGIINVGDPVTPVD